MKGRSAGLTLGIYADLQFRREAGVLATDMAFGRLLASLAERCDSLVIFGRENPALENADAQFPSAKVEFVPLPNYSSLSSLKQVSSSAARSARALNARLKDLDALWLFGPHPLALLFAGQAFRAKVPVYLGVRQDLPSYVGYRIKGKKRLPALASAWVLEFAFRLCSHVCPTIVVGHKLAVNYRRAARLLILTISLVPAAAVVSVEEAKLKDWSGQLEVLSVGRLDPEKNPLLLIDVLCALLKRHPAWRMTVVGDGSLAPDLAAYRERCGISDRLTLTGHVAFGSDLFRLYNRSHAFLHISSTEGVPQVLSEAMATGLPVVATDVGGVKDALAGKLGLLVPPNDPGAAAASLERLRQDAVIRNELIEAGVDYAKVHDLGFTVDRLVQFLSGLHTAKRPETMNRLPDRK